MTTLTSINPAAQAATRDDAARARTDAAVRLTQIPNQLAGAAILNGMTAELAGRQLSPAGLLSSPVSTGRTGAETRAAMLAAIDGVLKLYPQSDETRSTLQVAATGVAALVANAATTATEGNPSAIVRQFVTDLELVTEPIFDLARTLLDPRQ